MIVGVLQARCTSRRLPGKVLANVCGRPMILRQMDRLERAERMDRIVVATTTDPSDDPLAKLCAKRGWECYRGSVDDVLDRVLQAAGKSDHIVRLTADCPLADPELIDRVIATHLEGGHDYTSNTVTRTYPDGLDVEVVTRAAFQTAASEAKLPSEREHVTPFLYNHPERFKIGQVTEEHDHSAMRWTVDETADLEFVRTVYGELLPTVPEFTTEDVLELLERRPELVQFNEHIPTNEGYDLSLQQDPTESTEAGPTA